MNWIDKILQKVFNYFVIENAVGDPYMVRYRLVRFPFIRILLHHILRSDEDRELHDHPWDFVSIILWSGYEEVLPTGPRIVRAGSVVRHKATDAHRLILRRPAWTLVFASGKKKRVWGFHSDEGWMSYNDYLDLKYGVGNWKTF